MALAKVILIGGAPMTGKSTVARMLAGPLGYACMSTDDIGQAMEALTTPQSHPALHRMAGQDYREYYVTRDVEQLIADSEERHAVLWPGLERVIRAHAGWGTPMVMEGWALQPARVARLQVGNVASVWLIAEDDVLEQRVMQDDFWPGASDGQAMVRHFLARSVACNARIREAAGRLRLPTIDVRGDELPADLTGRCLEAIGPDGK